MRFGKRRAAVLLTALALAAAGCSSAASQNDDAGAGSTVPGKDSKAVGFIFVGPKDDYGYNQAAFQGSEEIKKAFPDLEVITAENVPEDDNAARVMNSMIQKGAKIIFATSYGHLDAALKVAEEHPDVVVVQQGNVIADGKVTANTGTYFGTVYEPVYLAGIAAGLTTKTNKLGYVYAFPIPQTIANINAFELGAKSVNPEAKTYTVNTSNWCDPAKQAQATQSLLSQGVDVITQHQDCTGTVIKTTEAAGAFTVGYHADASELAPKGWLTGSEWNWGPLYTDIVKTALAGEFTGSKYNANYRVGYKNGENPFIQSEFGPAVSAEAKAAIEQAKTAISAADGSPFVGPVTDQDGTVQIPAGTVPDYATLDGIDFFVDGVIGELPKS
ncbi:BMP family ABC transporter substrate-binding protein [Frankia sp. CNm7]|uniref:BMP family ABC transporter substrate-binding protein n=1 Tax=Frankia nepalensis TaxID=1836974 RepID=A0A937ULB1_9ACTN|nr:BMP family ABC transporter substrate-binding protein [Frankia nepalensis]MBL7494783.1 BMP family ABC transporter substrate-binding protein [Frankia nepalensis]MBL7516497.1 BMP family ABC transporter substrate-binding protein [Frankia nepalensis]MBL7518182.1 BMP family ABC transporter substrate-binding protein [Frankia nepalensis]MBL7625843.1 BMP family ABC transporter substrate-binding protein [Frankia nepalensis]